MKQSHVELQDYLLESSKTEKDQNASNKQTKFQETITTAFQELPSITEISIKVKKNFLIFLKNYFLYRSHLWCLNLKAYR